MNVTVFRPLKDETKEFSQSVSDHTRTVRDINGKGEYPMVKTDWLCKDFSFFRKYGG